MWTICCIVSVLVVVEGGTDRELARRPRNLGGVLDWIPTGPPHSSKVPFWMQAKTTFNCERAGFFPDNTNCKQFYQCVPFLAGRFIQHVYECDDGLAYSVAAASCVKREDSDRPQCSQTTDQQSQPGMRTYPQLPGLQMKLQPQSQPPPQPPPQQQDQLQSQPQPRPQTQQQHELQPHPQPQSQPQQQHEPQPQQQHEPQPQQQHQPQPQLQQQPQRQSLPQPQPQRQPLPQPEKKMPQTTPYDPPDRRANESNKSNETVRESEQPGSDQTHDLDVDASTSDKPACITDCDTSSDYPEERLKNATSEEGTLGRDTCPPNKSITEKFGKNSIMERHENEEESSIASDTHREHVCSEEGFFGNPNDCSRFYRCVAFGSVFFKYEFSCHFGTLWDDLSKSCNFPVIVRSSGKCKYPVAATVPRASFDSKDYEPIGNLTGTRSSFVCPTGFRRYSGYCNVFYQCTVNDRLKINLTTFACSEGMLFDDKTIRCARNETMAHEMDETKECDVNWQIHGERRDTIAILNLPDKGLCTNEGEFPYGGTCSNKYFKCVRNQNGTLEGYLLDCPAGQLYSSFSAACVPRNLFPSCVY